MVCNTFPKLLALKIIQGEAIDWSGDDGLQPEAAQLARDMLQACNHRCTCPQAP